MQFAAPKVRGLPPGSQSLLSWKNREFALHRARAIRSQLRNDTDHSSTDSPHTKTPRSASGDGALLGCDRGQAASDRLTIWWFRSRNVRATKPLCALRVGFPGYVSMSANAGVISPEDSEDKGRFLSAGFHNVMGFFRDDVPLMELILDDEGPPGTRSPVARFRFRRGVHRAHLGCSTT
jgi:hypothetical protein